MLALEAEVRKWVVVATALWLYLLPLVLLSCTLFCGWISPQLTGSYRLVPLLPGYSQLL